MSHTSSCDRIRESIVKGILGEWECSVVHSEDGIFSVVTGLLLPNNDCVEVVLQQQGESFLVTDNSNADSFLYVHGIDLADKKQKDKELKMHKIVERYNLTYDKNEIFGTYPESRLFEGICLVSEAIRDACSMIAGIHPTRDDFTDSVYGFFLSKNAKVEKDYRVKGYTQSNKFDLKLNGNNTVLVKTISTENSSSIHVNIERAWYAFSDLKSASYSFNPLVIFDDSDPEKSGAWNEQHFSKLEKHNIHAYGFMQNRDQIERLAEEHQNL